MFYLLENHKIIDTNELLNSGIQISIKKSQKFKVVYLIGWFGERFFGTIKKQSENVFDLVEEGDLIKDDNCLYEVREISDGKDDNGRKSAISQPGMFKHWEWNIEAIYKPNSNGDYIKVWEKKDE